VAVQSGHLDQPATEGRDQHRLAVGKHAGSADPAFRPWGPGAAGSSGPVSGRAGSTPARPADPALVHVALVVTTDSATAPPPGCRADAFVDLVVARIHGLDHFAARSRLRSIHPATLPPDPCSCKVISTLPLGRRA
jgi:hypothetical protein